MRVLVTGGVRSGKSAHAEHLLEGRAAVTYVATGIVAGDDASWTARIETHRARRQPHWTTLETADLVQAFASVEAGTAVLVDSLGTWLAARLDAYGAWADPSGSWQDDLRTELQAVVEALPADTVLVTDEVGLGGVAGDPGARLFADLLGEVNQATAAACDEVHLVVAGRVLRL